MDIMKLIKDEDSSDSVNRIRNIIDNLVEIRDEVYRFGIDTTIDDDINVAIGQLKGLSSDEINDDKIIEILVLLSDRTKTKTHSIKENYVTTIINIINAKIMVLAEVEKIAAGKHALSGLFKPSVIFSIVFGILLIIGSVLLVDIFHPAVFKDIGITK